jgi:hypothetical protein
VNWRSAYSTNHNIWRTLPERVTLQCTWRPTKIKVIDDQLLGAVDESMAMNRE